MVEYVFSTSSDEGVAIQNRNPISPLPIGDDFDLQEKEEFRNGSSVRVLLHGKGGLGKLGATFNTINSILGGGILSFPYAFASAGIIPAIIATFILGIFAYLSILIIIITYERY